MSITQKLKKITKLYDVIRDATKTNFELQELFLKTSTTSSATRTIRFSEADVRDIDLFLSENPFFDFSTLARIAIREFMLNPQLQIKSLSSKTKESAKETKGWRK